MKTSSFSPLPLSAWRVASFGACVLAAASLAGCAGFTAASPSSTPDALTSTASTGKVAGGNQPLVGAHIFFYGVGSSGYGSASVSLLTSGTAGVTTDGTGSYLTTDSTGSFSFTSANYTCSGSVGRYVTPTYMVSVGGNPGLTAGTNNSAAVLLAALPTCGNYSTVSFIDINELSTAAMLTAVQQFTADPAHIGASSSNLAGIVNAFTAVTDLYSLANGSALATNLAGTGTVPQAKLNTLGNILTPCVNSAGPGSQDCQNLFAAATPANGTAPSTVAGAMLLIAQNPTSKVSNLYGLSTANAPFQTALSKQPNDFAIGINLAGGGATTPINVVIDATNNAWVASCGTCTGGTQDTIVEFSPRGAVLSGANGYSTGIHMPQSLAFDASGNLWSIDLASGSLPDQVVQQSAAGLLNFAFNDSTINKPEGIAIDKANNAWVANQGGSFNIDKINANGTRTMAPVVDSNLAYPTGVAFDGNQNLFIAGTGSGSVAEISTAGTVLNDYSPAGVTQPIGVSVDHTGNIFSVNNDTSQISEFNGANGTAAANSPYGVGVSDAFQVTVDGLGTGWVANCYCEQNGKLGSLIHFSPTGTILTTLQTTNQVNSTASAIDASGNVWVTNNGSANLTEFLGVAAPVTTPLVAASNANTLGTRP